MLAIGVLTSLIAAAPAAAEWAAPVEISEAGTRNASSLDIDANPAGDGVAAWQYGTSGVATVVSPAGSGPLAPQTYAGSYGSPTVGVGGNSVGALAFQLQPYGIFAASKPGTESSFGAAAQIEGPPNETGMKSPILSVNDEGTAQLFHGIEDQTFGFGSQFTGRLLTEPATNTWSSGENFSTGEPFTHNSAVATAADGSTVLLLKSDNGLNFREIIPAVIENGGSASNGAAIDASSGNGSGALTNPSGLSVARMPDASVVAAFERKAGTGGGIFVADFSKSRASGASGTGLVEIPVSGDEDGSQPKVATDAAGNSIVIWYDPSNGPGDPNAIRARFRPAGSATWGAEETVATGTLGALDLAVDALGNAFVVYQDDEADAVKSRIRMPGAAGAWQAPETVSTGLSGVEEPLVVAGGEYEAFAAFTADNGGGAPARAVYWATGAPSEEGGGGSSGGGEGGGSSAGSSASSTGSSGSGGGAGSGGSSGRGTLPPPVLGKSVDVEPAKGVVKIRCKGQRRFRPLAAGARIPLGCLVDTRHGVVVLTSASGHGGGTQTAKFWNGLFRVGQTGGRLPYTTLALRGPLGCGGNGRRRTRRHRGSRHRAQASRRRHKKGHGGGRGLWGSGKGHFRTKGRYGSASVRGTIWFVGDRCDLSTLFAVRRGVVRVHDDTLGRNLNLRAGHRYVARPGRGKRGRH
ncbi:MAG TPA: hypothetical protein VJ989_10090 [Solirubrobacterales bacterium]|nr:hypothetical protein [Solirubrobacterales bacterium]